MLATGEVESFSWIDGGNLLATNGFTASIDGTNVII
jgi:hypothetical protein